MAMFRLRPTLGVMVCALAAISTSVGADETAVSEHLAAWRVLRNMDCARCHGHDYAGSAAPSILDFVRSQSRARFDQIMLDGDPGRGMPGYRGQDLVARNLDELYAYFLARASGRLGAGRPAP